MTCLTLPMRAVRSRVCRLRLLATPQSLADRAIASPPPNPRQTSTERTPAKEGNR